MKNLPFHLPEKLNRTATIFHWVPGSFVAALLVVALCRCTGDTSRSGQWCVYEVVAAEGKCPSGAATKSFCRNCITPCPVNFDTTIIKGNDTCYYTLRVIDKNCRSCPPNSLP